LRKLSIPRSSNRALRRRPHLCSGNAPGRKSLGPSRLRLQVLAGRLRRQRLIDHQSLRWLLRRSTPGFGTDFRDTNDGGPHHAVHRFFEGGFFYLDRDARWPAEPGSPVPADRPIGARRRAGAVGPTRIEEVALRRRREACWCPRRRPKGYGWSRPSKRGLPTVALVAAQPILSKLDYH